MGYQENILPKMHKQQGHEVSIITSRFTFDNQGTISSRDVGDYINRDGIKVHVIDYSRMNKYIRYATIHGSYFCLLKSLKRI